MKNIAIRELEPSDMEKIRDLLRTREELDEEGVEIRTRIFEWVAFRNPFADGDPTYFVAEDSNKIIAHLGRMPTQFIINGHLQKGYFIHDLYVHPEYRKKGFAFFLSMSLYRAIENESESFCCLAWTTELNLGMQRRRGYQELWAQRYIKLINPTEHLGKFVDSKFLVAIVSMILERIFFLADLILLSLVPSKQKVLKIEKFDSRFDTLNQSILTKVGVCPCKQSNYLNWKYTDRPFNNLEVFAAEEDGRIQGFVVLAFDAQNHYPRGSVVDIFAGPEDTKTISSLCRTTVDYFRKRKVYSVDCCLTDKRFVRVFKKFLFLRASGKQPVMLANLEKCEVNKYLTNINDWHFTYGHSDGFMWTVDQIQS